MTYEDNDSITKITGTCIFINGVLICFYFIVFYILVNISPKKDGGK